MPYDLTKIVMYVLIVVTLLFVMWLDRQDWECPSLYGDRSTCGPGKGMPFRHTQPSSTDTICESLKKLKKTAQAESHSVKWRKAAYISIIANFLILGLGVGKGSLPDWHVFYTCVILGFAIIFVILNWISYHQYREVQLRAEENIEQARKTAGCT